MSARWIVMIWFFVSGKRIPARWFKRSAFPAEGEDVSRIALRIDISCARVRSDRIEVGVDMREEGRAAASDCRKSNTP